MMFRSRRRRTPPDPRPAAGRAPERSLSTSRTGRIASPPPVVVGIDGSKDAVRVAMWAADLASEGGTFVRLVHVITGHPQKRDRGFAHAGRILHKAGEAIRSVNGSVIVDSDVFEGDLVTQLVEASRGAALICIASTKADPIVAELLGRADTPVGVMCPASRGRFGRRHHIEYETLAPVVTESAPTPAMPAGRAARGDLRP